MVPLDPDQSPSISGHPRGCEEVRMVHKFCFFIVIIEVDGNDRILRILRLARFYGCVIFSYEVQFLSLLRDGGKDGLAYLIVQEMIF